MQRPKRLPTATHAAESLKRRLAKRSKLQANGCVVWTGFLTDGYGRIGFWDDGKIRHLRPHRIVYAMHHNLPLAFDGFVCHSCDNRACINPTHLFLGTHTDNMADMVSKGRQGRGEKARAAKLTADQVRAIRADTRPYKVIGAQYGIAKRTISHIKARSSWRHVA